jgi:hypothetical protein
VTLSRTQQAKGGIAVALLKSMSFQEQVTAYGTVSDTQQLSDAWNRFVQGQAEQESTQAQLPAAREDYKRLSSLNQENPSASERSIQKAKATGCRPRPGSGGGSGASGPDGDPPAALGDCDRPVDCG